MLNIQSIKTEIAPIAIKYNIEKIELFGSYASGNQTENSDLDFLVKFCATTPSIFKVMGLKAEIEKNLKYLLI